MVGAQSSFLDEGEDLGLNLGFRASLPTFCRRGGSEAAFLHKVLVEPLLIKACVFVLGRMAADPFLFSPTLQSKIGSHPALSPFRV